LVGFCNRAIKRPALSNIQPITRPSPFWCFPVWQFQIALLPFGHPSYIPSVIIERWADHCTEVDRYVTFG
jgi:hypothetical protein